MANKEEKMALGKTNFHADSNNEMITINLTHFSKSDFIRWRPEKYKGTEFSNWNVKSRWPTWKPAGLYLGFGNEYMDWRFKGVNKAERIYKDMVTEKNWNFRHKLTIECNENDVYIINTIDDLPNPNFEHGRKTEQLARLSSVVEKDFRKEIGKPDVNKDRLTKEERDTLIDKIKMVGALEHYKDYHAWDYIQENYKAMYITQNFFDNYSDVYDLHMRQVIVFDTSIIVEKETYGELFNYREYVNDKFIDFDWNSAYISLYNDFYKQIMSNDTIEEYWDLLDDEVKFSMVHVHQSVLNKIIKERVRVEDEARALTERINSWKS